MNLMKRAVDLCKSGDIHYGHGSFLSHAIDDWAFKISGLYEPQKPLKEEVEPIYNELIQIIAEGWSLRPGWDFIGELMEELGGSGHLSYFQTPESLSKLLSSLNQPSVADGKTIIDQYEPCSGCGAITLSSIVDTYEREGFMGVARLDLHLEELDYTKTKASVIQIINLLKLLNENGIPLVVKGLTILQIDVINRKSVGLNYSFQGDPSVLIALESNSKKLQSSAA
ncbi:TPA: hypothetical protein I7730_15640 [Vibrio vulnificus]|uniref:DNA methylase adenine-specific domain-containing protein n=1 Tax=Vibrio vulnificus TaxID=672 RepID=A0A8H9N1P7_VIBVL|nr:hypothetical protein [Vibrio vulnificus]HAS8541214.1 hypothetical protein [Vibrio vulnificus]